MFTNFRSCWKVSKHLPRARKMPKVSCCYQLLGSDVARHYGLRSAPLLSYCLNQGSRGVADGSLGKGLFSKL